MVIDSRNYFMGKKVNFSGWQNDGVIDFRKTRVGMKISMYTLNL